MHGEEYSNALRIQVNGQLLAEDVRSLVVGGYVDDSINVPHLFVLRFSDPNALVLQKGGFSIGAVVKISVQRGGPGGPQPLVEGEVTALESDIDVDGIHTIVRGLDLSHRLYRGRRVEAYVNVTAGDVAAKVARRAGIAVGRIDALGAVLPHVTQDGVSDWEFLRRLADQVGAEVTVQDGKLNFCKPTDSADAPSATEKARQQPFTIERGVNLISLRATVTSAEQVPEVEVRGWDVDAKRALVAVAPARTRSATLDGVQPAALARTFGSPRYVLPVSGFGKQDQCDATAKAVAEHLAGGFAEIDGVASGNPRLRAGTAISLAKVGKPFEGKYTLSATRHEFSPETGYLTSFTVSNRSERSLYGVASGSAARDSRWDGVVTAQVSDIKDPENRGRVRITFPVMSDTYVSGWARTVQLGAGPERGSVVLPEVGDEVLVAFGQAGFEQPYVIGGLYNGKDKPAVAWNQHVGANDGAVKRRAFVSRTGMIVEMLESPEGEQLNVSTNGGKQRLSLIQKRDAGVELVSEGPVLVSAKTDVTVTAQGDISMEGTNITIKARSKLDLSGTNVSSAATSSSETKGAMVKVAGNMSAELSSGATTTVRGGLVRIN